MVSIEGEPVSLVKRFLDQDMLPKAFLDGKIFDGDISAESGIDDLYYLEAEEEEAINQQNTSPKNKG